jgi:hypothetical protein
MVRTTLISLCFVSLALAAGCKDKGGSSKPAGPTVLPKVGLSIDVPGAKDEIMVSDGMGPTSNMVNTVPTGGMMVEIEDAQPTVETVKSNAEMFTPKNLEDEKLADGFVVTFDNKGSMGANYFFEVHRTVDGKHINCSGNSDSAGKQAAAVAACKTIHK